jgi:Fungal protein kinase
VKGSVLTGGLTYKDRSGTLIDWNLCFNAHGESSNRVLGSGTPAFMAPVLLEYKYKQIPRRTLGHDLESFFTVIIWIATLNYSDEVAFMAKPLATLNMNKAPEDIANAKGYWFKDPREFRESLIHYFEPPYRKDAGFLRCLLKLRRILYTTNEFDEDEFLSDEDNSKVTEDDPMKEGQFQKCVKEIDDYLGETKGCEEIEWINANTQA